MAAAVRQEAVCENCAEEMVVLLTSPAKLASGGDGRDNMLREAVTKRLHDGFKTVHDGFEIAA